MTPFFRKIRYRLAKDNQFFKYSRYAIGEIILVVIGILIAIQVNNWNEEKKNHEKENLLLMRMKSDLELDIIYLQNRMLQSKKIVQDHFKALEELYLIQDSISHIRELLNLIDFGSEMLTVQNSTYEEINNTGKIELINNMDLKNELNNYYNDCSKAEKHFEEINFYSAQVMKDLFKEVPQIIRINSFSDETNQFYDQFIKVNDGNWNFINDTNSVEFFKLEATVLAYRNKNLIFIDHFDTLITRSRALIELINKELKSD
jgi:hypothetical protein